MILNGTAIQSVQASYIRSSGYPCHLIHQKQSNVHNKIFKLKWAPKKNDTLYYIKQAANRQAEVKRDGEREKERAHKE